MLKIRRARGPRACGTGARGPRAQESPTNQKAIQKTQKDAKVNLEVVIMEEKKNSQKQCTRENTKSSKTDLKLYQIKMTFS